MLAVITSQAAAELAYPAIGNSFRKSVTCAFMVVLLLVQATSLVNGACNVDDKQAAVGQCQLLGSIAIAYGAWH
jgi:hypothetical protein